mmetsp:Transcript_67095/g.106683  ORF Transcript_67095/g.106683 Transcript_67095/m.106683 type:complete len:164 (+) Transcript_67095:155-646(+)
MPDHKGYRAKSRHVFRKKIHGMPKPTKTLQVYRLGEYVTIKMDPAIHKGMAHRIYHGKTGVVWNITQRSVGVLLKKKVGNRYRTKKLHVRIEHIVPSGCRKDFLQRCRFNANYSQNHKKDPKKYPRRVLRRTPKGPDPACLVEVGKSKMVELKIQPHVDKVEM